MKKLSFVVIATFFALCAGAVAEEVEEGIICPEGPDKAVCCTGYADSVYDICMNDQNAIEGFCYDQAADLCLEWAVNETFNTCYGYNYPAGDPLLERCLAITTLQLYISCMQGGGYAYYYQSCMQDYLSNLAYQCMVLQYQTYSYCMTN